MARRKVETTRRAPCRRSAVCTFHQGWMQCGAVRCRTVQRSAAQRSVPRLMNGWPRSLCFSSPIPHPPSPTNLGTPAWPWGRMKFHVRWRAHCLFLEACQVLDTHPAYSIHQVSIPLCYEMRGMWGRWGRSAVQTHVPLARCQGILAFTDSPWPPVCPPQHST